MTTRTSGSPNTPRTVLRARKPANEYPSDSRRCPLPDFAIPHDARSPRRSKSPKANVHRPLHYFQPQNHPLDFQKTHKWNAEQVHDYVLFMANTGLRPDEARNLQHRDVEIVEDQATGERILEIEVRGKRGVGFCKSMPSAVRPYERLLNRPKPTAAESRRDRQKRRREGGAEPEPPKQELPQPTDHVFPGNHIKLFNGVPRPDQAQA